MTAVRNVLVAFEFGDTSEAVLAYGRAFARSFGAVLHVMHVTENAFLRAVAGDPRNMEEAALQHLNERLTEEDRRALNVRVVSETSDNPAHAVVDYARAEHVDLVITGTHGRTGLNRTLMGSVAEQIVRTAPCPVLTVRQHERDFVRLGHPHDSTITLKKMLVPTDFGEAADAALVLARSLAGRFGAELHAMHVVPDAYLNTLGDSIATVNPALGLELEQAARTRLEKSLAMRDVAAGTTKAVVMTAASPTFAVLDYAKAQGMDLIVLGTHGRNTLGRMLMGSVAERVVRLAPCPVLTVHS